MCCRGPRVRLHGCRVGSSQVDGRISRIVASELAVGLALTHRFCPRGIVVSSDSKRLSIFVGSVVPFLSPAASSFHLITVFICCLGSSSPSRFLSYLLYMVTRLSSSFISSSLPHFYFLYSLPDYFLDQSRLLSLVLFCVDFVSLAGGRRWADRFSRSLAPPVLYGTPRRVDPLSTCSFPFLDGQAGLWARRWLVLVRRFLVGTRVLGEPLTLTFIPLFLFSSTFRVSPLGSQTTVSAPHFPVFDITSLLRGVVSGGCSPNGLSSSLADERAREGALGWWIVGCAFCWTLVRGVVLGSVGVVWAGGCVGAGSWVSWVSGFLARGGGLVWVGSGLWWWCGGVYCTV